MQENPGDQLLPSGNHLTPPGDQRLPSRETPRTSLGTNLPLRDTTSRPLGTDVGVSLPGDQLTPPGHNSPGQKTRPLGTDVGVGVQQWLDASGGT